MIDSLLFQSIICGWGAYVLCAVFLLMAVYKWALTNFYEAQLISLIVGVAAGYSYFSIHGGN